MNDSSASATAGPFSSVSPPQQSGGVFGGGPLSAPGNLLFLALLLVLFGLSRWNYLFFHSLAELFSIAVAYGLFMLVWNARRFIGNEALILLGCAYLFIGTLDLVHTLAYKGMGVFPDDLGANAATQLWIAARYLESLSLLAFTLMVGRPLRLRLGWLMGGYGAVSALIFATIFVWPLFPACYVEGVGLTTFKKGSEYLIGGILLGALGILWRKRRRFPRQVFYLMAAAIALTILGELAFTYYVSVYGASNLIGHFAKIGSFFLVYLALIRSGLTEPYGVLFRKWRQSDQNYQRLVEAAPLSIMTFDAGGAVTYVNPFHLRTFAAGKHDADFFIGRKIHELPGIVRAGVADQVVRVLRGEEVLLPDVHFPEFNGGHAGYQRIRAVPFHGNDGGVIGGLLMREDISRQRHSEALFKRALMTSLDGFWLVSGDGVIEACNQAAAAMLGVAVAELEGQPIGAVDAVESPEQTRRRIRKIRREGEGRFRSRHRRKDGRLIDVEVSTSLLSPGDERMVAFVRDITEKEAQQARLRLSEEKFARAFQRSPLLMTLSALEDGTYREVNDIFVQATGYRREDCLGRTSTEIGFIPAAARRHLKAQLVEKGRVSGEELTLSRKDGATMVCEYWGELITVGDEPQLLSIALDITSRKRMERLLRLRIELSQYADTHSVKALMQRTLDGAEQLTGSRIGFFHVIDTEKQCVDLQMWSTQTLEHSCRAEEFQHHYPLADAGVWADCVREGRPVIHNDYARLKNRKGLPAGHAPVVRELVVPVLRDNRVVASLGVGNKPTDYGEEDIQIVSELVNMAWDIVTRRKAERALSRSRRSLETLLGNLPGMAFRCRNDAFWTMAYVSDGCRALTGYDAEDLVDNRTLSYNDLIHPADRERVWEEIQAALEDGTHYEIEYRILDKSGWEHWVWERGQQISADDDDGVLLAGFITEVTERRQQEAELRRLATAIDQVAEAIIVTDPEGQIIFVNAAFEKITGYPRRVAIGRNPRMLSSGEQDAAFYRDLWATITAGRVWSGNLVNRKKDGSLYTEKATISPVCGPAGEIINYVAVKQDITDELRLEEKLGQAQKMEAIGTLAGGIAHDFNNILFPLVGFTEMLGDDLPADSPLQEYVADIFAAAMRAKELVQQILAFSRQSTRENSAIRVQLILKEAVKLTRASLPSNIEVHQQVQRDCPPILADPTQIHQIIMNLITNAYHAMEAEGGTLTLDLQTVLIGAEGEETSGLHPGTYLRLRVSDTGHGIDPAIQARIFEPYFTTKGEGKGTGLGLSVIHGIVSDCRGEVQVKSAPGRGTTFTIHLPCIEARRPGGTAAAEEPVRGGSERILLVDDEAPIIGMISRMLERLGYGVTARTASVEALEIFRTDPKRFDLVITDMTMPNMTGDQLTLALKKIRPEIPVIVCTGFSERIDAERAVAIGAQGFVHKPILKAEIARTIRQALEEGAEAAP